MTEPLVQRVRDFIRAHDLVSRGEVLVIGVSGGPDSVCLLHVLATLKDEMGIGLAVGHLNHGLRGDEAEADARYVWEMTRRLGIPATVERRDVTAYQAQHCVSLEEAAREVRYAFLSEVAHLVGAERVLVGHTSDDNIETVLLHLIRGSGSRGLRGLQPVSRWRLAAPGAAVTVVRPLLPVTRQETEEYCGRNKLAPRLDLSNLSLSPLRNRVRHQLLPLLKSYNPRVGQGLLRMGKIVSDDLAHIEEEGTRFWDQVAKEQQGAIILYREPLLGMHPSLQRQLLRTAIERLLGNLRDIEMRHIEELVTALAKPAGKKISLPGNLVFAVEYDRYVLGPEPEKLCPFPPLEGEFALNVPGETVIPGWRIEAQVFDQKPPIEGGDAFAAHFGYGRTGSRLSVRARRSGDRFQPLGMSQPKKLGEFMIDTRIPRSWRERIPIVCSATQIVWVVGWRIDERVKVRDDTREVLRLAFARAY